MDRLVIYTGFGHRSITSESSLVSLPKGVNPASIIVKHGSDICPFVILENSRNVLVIKYDKDGKERSYEGNLVRVDQTSITIETSGGLITISYYDTITQPHASTQIEIKCPKKSRTKQQNRFKVSYLSSELSWIGQINVSVRDDEIIFLQLLANIENTTKTVMKLTDLQVVAGDMSMPDVSSRGAKMGRMMRSAPMAMAAESTVRDNEPSYQVNEFKKYMLGEYELREDNLIRIGEWYNIPTEKVYYNEIGYKLVSFEYGFKAPDFLPRSKVNVYEDEEDDALTLIGGTVIFNTEKDEEIRISLGLTSQIVIDSRVERKALKTKDIETAKGSTRDDEEVSDSQVMYDQTNRWEYLVSLTSNIRNLTDKQARVILRHFIGDSTIEDYIVDENRSKSKGTKRKISIKTEYRFKNGYMEFEISVPAKGQIDFQKRFKLIQ